MTQWIDTTVSFSTWAAILLASGWQLKCSSPGTFAIKYPSFTKEKQIRTFQRR